MIEALQSFLQMTGFFLVTWQMLVMWLIVLTLLYLGIYRGFEPLLLIPIAFGAFLANLPTQGILNAPVYNPGGELVSPGGLYYYIQQGIHLELFPPLIFLGVGALTDFGPLIANPRTLLLGAAAQLGVFVTFFCSTQLPWLGFTSGEAASIGIIGGADGPTAIFTTNKLAPHLLGPVAVAAYSYMALVPLIQPPIMRLLTTEKERAVVMEQLRPVSKKEKIVFPILVAAFVILLLPATAPLIGCLMLGNLMRECGVVDRLSDTAQNALMNIVTIFLGLSVGATTVAENFLQLQTYTFYLKKIY